MTSTHMKVFARNGCKRGLNTTAENKHCFSSPGARWTVCWTVCWDTLVTERSGTQGWRCVRWHCVDVTSRLVGIRSLSRGCRWSDCDTALRRSHRAWESRCKMWKLMVAGDIQLFAKFLFRGNRKKTTSGKTQYAANQDKWPVTPSRRAKI